MEKKIKKKIEKIKEPLRVKLGCGQNKVEGFKGLDICDGIGADWVHDLTVYPWPFEDDSVDEYLAAHVFEHIPALHRGKFMDEVWRTLKMGASIRVITPGHMCDRAWQDYSHIMPPIVPSSYNYFMRDYREFNKLTHGVYDLKCNFSVSINGVVDGTWINRSEDAKQFASRHYWNVINDYDVTMIKIP
ncbi:MAG TPA: hypothetical protein VKR58_05800 [Aquella sp.]|nr:hypothetical protein [Aquella sp.]